MKKIMIAYVSRTGKTEKMAEYIAEGVRFCGPASITEGQWGKKRGYRSRGDAR